MLPSIASLLNAEPSSPRMPIPAFNISPPSPVSSRSSSPPTLMMDTKQSKPLYEPHRQHSHSPLLSPATSHTSPSLSPSRSPYLSPCKSPRRSPSLQPPLSSIPSPDLQSSEMDVVLPPLQGYDPPRTRARDLDSQSAPVIHVAPWSNAAEFPAHYPEKKRRLSHDSSLSRPLSSDTQHLSPVPTVVSISPTDHSHVIPPPTTQILMSPSGQTILKRRRGRPPSMREPTWEGGWTFLTPTVWDVKSQNGPQSDLPLPVSESEGVMNGSLAAFTSANMDTVLHMPRKKRGRKPKTHINGNSCFVWREITSTRTSKKSRKDLPTTIPTPPSEA